LLNLIDSFFSDVVPGLSITVMHEPLAKKPCYGKSYEDHIKSSAKHQNHSCGINNTCIVKSDKRNSTEPSEDVQIIHSNYSVKCTVGDLDKSFLNIQGLKSKANLHHLRTTQRAPVVNMHQFGNKKPLLESQNLPQASKQHSFNKYNGTLYGQLNEQTNQQSPRGIKRQVNLCNKVDVIGAKNDSSDDEAMEVQTDQQIRVVNGSSPSYPSETMKPAGSYVLNNNCLQKTE